MSERATCVYRMNSRTLNELKKLCRENKSVFSESFSPDLEQLNAFYPRFMAMDHVGGLRHSRGLGELTDALERSYRELLFGSATPDFLDEQHQMLISQKAREREVRFIRMMADFLKHEAKSFGEVSPSEIRKEIKSAINSLRKTSGLLNRFKEDFYFKSGLRFQEDREFFKYCSEHMPNFIENLDHSLNNDLFKFPYKRIKKKQDTYASDEITIFENTNNYKLKNFVDLIATACYTIYANCNPSVIELALDEDWQEFALDGPNLAGIISQACDRKISRFGRVGESPPYPHEGSSGGLEPARTIAPPWMDDAGYVSVEPPGPDDIVGECTPIK